MNWRNWNDDDLCRVFESTYRKPAFANTPIWKKIGLWVVCLVFPLLGFAALFQMISRSPSAVGVLVALGAVGVVSLVQVIKAERTFHQEKRALLEELERRELYEQGGVRFVAPREDPTRP